MKKYLLTALVVLSGVTAMAKQATRNYECRAAGLPDKVLSLEATVGTSFVEIKNVKHNGQSTAEEFTKGITLLLAEERVKDEVLRSIHLNGGIVLKADSLQNITAYLALGFDGSNFIPYWIDLGKPGYQTIRYKLQCWSVQSNY